MSDGNPPKKPTLRVIPDEEEEVVSRLAPAKKVGNFRRTAEQAALVQTVAEKPEKLARNDLGQYETEAASKENFKIPPLAIIAVVLAFGGLLGMGIFLAATSSPAQKRRKIQGSESDIRSGFHAFREMGEPTAEEREVARELANSIEEVSRAYCAATTIEEKLKYVRHPERVAPLMESHYAKLGEVEHGEYKLTTHMAQPIDIYSFVVLTGTLDGKSKPLLAETVSSTEIKIDWEADVCYQPSDIDEFLEKRDTELASFRVYARIDNFYVYEFHDYKKYQCLRLTLRDSDKHLYGYVERNSDLGLRLALRFESAKQLSNGQDTTEPLFVKVRFPENSRFENGVFIEEVIVPRWALLTHDLEKTEEENQ